MVVAFSFVDGAPAADDLRAMLLLLLLRQTHAQQRVCRVKRSWGPLCCKVLVFNAVRWTVTDNGRPAVRPSVRPSVCRMHAARFIVTESREFFFSRTHAAPSAAGQIAVGFSAACV
jgi:hypothetical protein